LSSPSLGLAQAAFLFLAALVGGTLNAVAGGGSFVAFPALLFTGVPAVPANATNCVALWMGLFFSGGAFRHHLHVSRAPLIALSAASLAGGILGALLLLRTPGQTFLRIVPWLMLSATLLFVFGPRFAQARGRASREAGAASLTIASFFQLVIGIYGGYFGGGMGFVILALLSAVGMADIHEMNAFKIVLSASTNGIAVLIFVLKHAIYWPQAGIMIVGAGLGGYLGAHYSLRLPRSWVRRFVIAVGAIMTGYFFINAYA
jgi:uncharacterized membrane protein YfcA